MAQLIMIDPGHGGRDPGAVANGVQEKVPAFRASLFLRDALLRHGFQVQMTRNSDALPLPSGTISQDLSYRVTLANRAGADLFVSWHYNAASSTTASGISVHIHPNADATTRKIAALIHDRLVSVTGQRARGVEEDDFAVLRETIMPAVLIEGGFVTNPEEAAMIKSDDKLKRQAEAVARGICVAYGVAYQPPDDEPATHQPKIDLQAGRAVIDLIGKLWERTSDPDRVALNFAANALRRAIGDVVTTDMGKPATDAAKRCTGLLGALWQVSRSDGEQAALHAAAEALRSV